MKTQFQRRKILCICYLIRAKSRTFGTHSNIDDCKADAISHAAENTRIKGEYIITKVEEIGNTGLVSADLTQKPYKGIKHGKSIEWID